MTDYTEKQAWKAIAERDPTYDGKLYYGVMTTGVFCRPSCPSRPAKRANMKLFTTPQAAMEAGLRPCLRCHPMDNAGGKIGRIMTKVAAYIDGHAGESLSLTHLAEKFFLSPAHLQKSFKGQFGVSPKAYQNARRLEGLKQALKDGDDISGAIYEAGYGSVSRVYEQVDGRIGMTLSAYRAGGQGERIAYAYGQTALGLLLMAATDRGVCFLHFGEEKTALRAQLEKEYPHADLVPGSAENTPELEAWIAALDHYLTAGGSSPDIPLHLNGTAFQMKVWRFLMGVPEGTVRSYSEVAEAIGAPKAIRAAASACAANNIALLVPCHRVLRRDGGLGGYRWGEERKRSLLDQERQKDRV
tara:strand:- start:9385 stop:10455 length:1071 start_codon:yes stop_codon:yes gene_type:complete